MPSPEDFIMWIPTVLTPQSFVLALEGALITAMVFALLLVLKALRDYSTAGPQLRKDILDQYRLYAVWALCRLTFWAFLIALYWSGAGVLVYLYCAVLFGWPVSLPGSIIAAAAGLAGTITLQFLRFLLHCPAVIAASSHYRLSRFYRLWGGLSPALFKYFHTVLILIAALLLAGTWARLISHQDWVTLIILSSSTLTLVMVAFYAVWAPEPQPVQPSTGAPTPPNVLMIGSDTLRADRLGVAGYHRALTPTLDALVSRGVWFKNCYVPCARTAPSLLSMLTGTWPHTHGVRDNFVEDTETHLKVPSLPQILADRGYRTVAVSDWCGADLGKFNLGFQEQDLPADSWNLRYLLRQGPKDLRLFLSLFMRNRLGKKILPEIYYLGGVPSTDTLGRDARRTLSNLARDGRPFLLNVFFSTTHPPFGSEYPYYTLFSEPDYGGESKFAMARLTDPFEIIRRQGEPRSEFDLDQILNLYDGCVKRFDDEVSRLLAHLKACGLDKNTLVVVYSDHGMEFFEHGTWGQGNSVFGDHSARIPLIVSDPSLDTPIQLEGVTRTIDLAPTLLELLGLPPASGMEGVSLADAMRGGPHPDLPAFYETGIWLTDLPCMPAGHLRYPNLLELLEIPDKNSGTLAIKPEYQTRIYTAKDRMIRQGRWKLVYQPLEQDYSLMLYDIQQDPDCRTNVIATHQEIARPLWGELSAWIARSSTETPLVENPSPNKAEMPTLTSFASRLRRGALRVIRSADDRIYEHLARRTRVLFVLSDGYGFACQSPVIRALLKYPDVMVRTTTDRGQSISDIEFASDGDLQLFSQLYLPTQRARLTKWHMVVDAHMNGFYPARNALRVYMHHGPGFGILGNKIAVIRQCDIFCGLSETERDWFERLMPGIFGERRVFFPVGFPKNDALYRGEYDRQAILARWGLPDRRTLLITSHWQRQSTLRRLNGAPFRELATSFPDCNVIQTGHPWLWQPNHSVPAEWQDILLKDMHDVESHHHNARFIQTSDVESLLAVADLLVGDYSSVMTTYSLLDRPIVYFADPEFQFSIPELREVFLDAAHTFTRIEELVMACEMAFNNPDVKAEGRAVMRSTFFSNEGSSSEYMAELIHAMGHTFSTGSRNWQYAQVLNSRAIS